MGDNKTGSIRVRAPEETELRTAEPRQLQLLDVEELAHQLALRLNPPKPPGKTFGELCDVWLHTGCKRRLDTRNEQRHVELLRGLWELTETELTPKRARAELAALLKPLGPLGAATVNKVRNTAARVIREAQIEGEWGGVNPFDLLARYKEHAPEHVPIRLGDARRALPFLRRDRWREAVLAILLGPRPGEVKALWKTDVDLKGRRLTFRRSNARDRTKTGTARTVPIPTELLEVLKEAMAASTSKWVFPKLRHESQQRADTKLTRTLRAAFVAAGIVVRWEYLCRRRGCGFRDASQEKLDRRCPKCEMRLWRNGVAPAVTWYGLRHSAATLHIEAGCNPLVVRRCLGHAAKDTTDGTYIHLTEQYMRRQLNKLRLLRR